MDTPKKKIKLVLSSGGARGMAHIGVIEMLQADGYEIVEVVGCSMGAIVGGIFCAGKLAAYKDWLVRLDHAGVVDLLDITLLAGQGFVKGEKLFSKILEIVGEQRIEQMPIPFKAVATNMLNMQEIHYAEGNLFSALRASASMPGVFVPVVEDDRLIVDGGVLNPLPVDLVERHPEIPLVAVNVNGYSPLVDLEQPSHPTPAPLSARGWIPKYLSSILQWRRAPKTKPKAPRISLLNLLGASYDFTQDRLIQMMVKHYQPDLLVEISRGACGAFEFGRAEEIIELGRQAYKKAVEQRGAAV